MKIRYFWFFVGLLLNAFGIAWITKAALGTSQISSIPYVLSLKFQQLSFGGFTLLFNLAMLLLQFILLKRKFKVFQLLQIAAAAVFSWFIDCNMKILGGVHLDNLAFRVAALIFGCAVLALGICIEVAPNVLMVPGEAIVQVLAAETKSRFGTVKVVFDVSLIGAAVLLSFLFFKRLNGVGPGTVVSAILVGKLVNLYQARLSFIQKISNLHR